jgi:hypothetical protein
MHWNSLTLKGKEGENKVATVITPANKIFSRMMALLNIEREK